MSGTALRRPIGFIPGFARPGSRAGQRAGVVLAWCGKQVGNEGLAAASDAGRPAALVAREPPGDPRDHHPRRPALSDFVGATVELSPLRGGSTTATPTAEFFSPLSGIGLVSYGHCTG